MSGKTDNQHKTNVRKLVCHVVTTDQNNARKLVCHVVTTDQQNTKRIHALWQRIWNSFSPLVQSFNISFQSNCLAAAATKLKRWMQSLEQTLILNYTWNNKAIHLYQDTTKTVQLASWKLTPQNKVWKNGRQMLSHWKWQYPSLLWYCLYQK